MKGKARKGVRMAQYRRQSSGRVREQTRRERESEKRRKERKTIMRERVVRHREASKDQVQVCQLIISLALSF